MMAFGLAARTVLGMTATESVLVGVLGTVTGVAAGYGLLAWLTATTIVGVMPESASPPRCPPEPWTASCSAESGAASKQSQVSPIGTRPKSRLGGPVRHVRRGR
jgi:predicted lysophospholipase L1 biosynthesis ABC-type transport system permease subunit